MQLLLGRTRCHLGTSLRWNLSEDFYKQQREYLYHFLERILLACRLVLISLIFIQGDSFQASFSLLIKLLVSLLPEAPENEVVQPYKESKSGEDESSQESRAGHKKDLMGDSC